MSSSAPVRPPARFVILAALDRKAASPEVLATALSLAGRTPGAVLHLLHVVERPIGVEATALGLYQQGLAAACRYLDETAKSVGAGSELAVVTDAPGDTVADVIRLQLPSTRTAVYALSSSTRRRPPSTEGSSTGASSTAPSKRSTTSAERRLSRRLPTGEWLAARCRHAAHTPADPR